MFSILFGFCLSAIGSEGNVISQGLEAMSKVMMKFVDIIMMYAPIGLGAYFASLVGELGPQLLGAYGRALAIYYPMCALYFVVAFPLYSYFAAGKTGVKRMFKYILPPTATSLATQSSIATLPINLEAAANIGVSKDIREIVLPIGATMHMDGTVLSSILRDFVHIWPVRPGVHRNWHLRDCGFGGYIGRRGHVRHPRWRPHW